MTWKIGDNSRPPKRFCQVIPANPASVFFACQALQRFTSSGVIPPRRSAGRPDAFGSALALRNPRAPARKVASSGLSLKSMAGIPSGRVTGFDQVHEAVFPERRATETKSELPGAPVIQMAVKSPGEADAA